MYKSTKQLVVYGLRKFYFTKFNQGKFKGGGELAFCVNIKEQFNQIFSCFTKLC